MQNKELKEQPIIIRGIFQVKTFHTNKRHADVTHHLSKPKQERIQMLWTRLCQSRSVHVQTQQSSNQRPVGLKKDSVSLRGGWLQFWHLSEGAPFPEWPNILNWTIASDLENEGGHRCRPSPWFIAIGCWVSGQWCTHVQMQGKNLQMDSCAFISSWTRMHWCNRERWKSRMELQRKKVKYSMSCAMLPESVSTGRWV